MAVVLLVQATASPWSTAVEGGLPLTGENAPDWSVLIESPVAGGVQFCSGSLISATAVLTAAHCLFDEGTGERFSDSAITVTVGRGDLTDDTDGVERNASSSEIHPEYEGPVTPNDLAVLRIPAVPSDYEVLPIARTAPVSIPATVLFGYGLTEGDGDLFGLLPEDRAQELRRTPDNAYIAHDCEDLHPSPDTVPFQYCVDRLNSDVEVHGGDSGAPWAVFQNGAWLQYLVHSGGGPETEIASTTGGSLGPKWQYQWIRDAAGLFDAAPGTIVRDVSTGDAWFIAEDGGRRWIPDGGTYECLVADGASVEDATLQEIQQIPDFVGTWATCGTGTQEECSVTPGPVAPGLDNMGFETGDLSSWGFGTVSEEICVTGADDFATPYEGDHMARLGRSQPSADVNQPGGPNELTQSFVVDSPTESFAYNMFTYDYTGFDEFRYSVTVEDSGGAVIAALQRGAWGQSGDIQLKSSGWQYAELDLADHIGETVNLTVSAGGTIDDLYAFWAYVDSAESGPPPSVAPLASVVSDTGSVTTDPQTGLVSISMPGFDTSDLTITSNVTCPGDETPTSVNLLMTGSPFPMTEDAQASGTYGVTIPAGDLINGPISIEVNCPTAGVFIQPIGALLLYDPSGVVSDSITGDPIEGARVTLFKVPNWLPGPGGTSASECQNDGPPWSQGAPTDLGVEVSPYGTEADGGNPEIEPDINPFSTNSSGYYGWEVAEGCWYVEVSMDGYETQVSPVVGVPPAVTTLDIALVREETNEVPVANDDEETTDEDTPVVIDVLENDADDGELAIAVLTDPANGSVMCSDVCDYTPDENFNGDDSFTYSIEDNDGATDSATVTVHVTPVNDDPVAVDDSFTVEAGSDPAEIDVLVNDSDPDGDPLSLATATTDLGSVAVNGSLTFTPPQTGGTATISYVITDGNGGEATGTLLVEVQPPGVAPVLDVTRFRLIDGRLMAANGTLDGVDVRCRDRLTLSADGKARTAERGYSILGQCVWITGRMFVTVDPADGSWAAMVWLPRRLSLEGPTADIPISLTIGDNTSEADISIRRFLFFWYL